MSMITIRTRIKKMRRLRHSPEMFASFLKSGSQWQSVAVFLNNGLDRAADFWGQLSAC